MTAQAIMMLYSIGIVARHYGVSPSTIRCDKIRTTSSTKGEPKEFKKTAEALTESPEMRKKTEAAGPAKVMSR